MKNPPNGGHRASRETLAGKVNLGLSEIVESRPSGDLSAHVRGIKDACKEDVSSDALIDLHTTEASFRSLNSSAPLISDKFQDAEVQLNHTQLSSEGVTHHGVNPKYSNPQVERANSARRTSPFIQQASPSVTNEIPLGRSANNRQRVLLFIIVVVGAVSGLFFSADKLPEELNLYSQLSMLANKKAAPAFFSFRYLGIASDEKFAKAASTFITLEPDSTRLSVSDLDAVAYKMQREEGKVIEGVQSHNQGVASGQDESTETRSTNTVELSKGADTKSIDQANEPGKQNIGASKARKEGDRYPVEINTNGPVEPRLPQRESPNAADEFRDPFARESVSQSPHFPKSDEVRAILEEPFRREILYKVETDTTVRAKPSVFGEGLADLRRGDTVLAVSRIGSWVRIRSKKGLSGYVQDKALGEGKEG